MLRRMLRSSSPCRIHLIWPELVKAREGPAAPALGWARPSEDGMPGVLPPQ